MHTKYMFSNIIGDVRQRIAKQFLP